MNEGQDKKTTTPDALALSEVVTVPSLMMVTSIVSEESLARDTHTHTHTHTRHRFGSSTVQFAVAYTTC